MFGDKFVLMFVHILERLVISISYSPGPAKSGNHCVKGYESPGKGSVL